MAVPLVTRSALDLITDALRELELLGARATPSAEDAQLGLLRLNQMLGSWATQRLTIPGVVRDLHPLVNGKASYTIGPGAADWNQPRPQWIQNAGLVNLSASGVETPLDVLTADRWAAVNIKPQTNNLPWAIYDDRAEPTGTITVFPTLQSAGSLQLALYIPVALQRYPDLSTQVGLGDGYEAAISRNLAVQLARPFGRPLTPDLLAEAAARLADVKRTNVDRTELTVDPAFCGRPLGGYDIYSDTYRGWRY